MIENRKNQKRFPMEIGIVFLENIAKKKWKPHLDFDQDACSYFLTQMNSIQQLFEFQIITPFFDETYSENNFLNDFSTPQITSNDKETVRKQFDDWLDNLINVVTHAGTKEKNIDYWIFITSENIPLNWNFREHSSEKTWAITSKQWQRSYSPPSLFEYLAITCFTCALYSLARDCGLHHDSHTQTKSCLFDFTRYKLHRKILVSSPWLCNSCEDRFQQLENMSKITNQIKILDSIKAILSRNWIGDLDKVGTPAYNLKKDYGFDLNANSGFYKSTKEKIQDFIKENQVLTLVLTAIGMMLAIFGIIKS